MYKYKIRLMPSNISVRKGNLGQVLPQIEQFLQNECKGGWEYYRTDALNLIENAGCLGGIFGASQTVIPVVLFVFRKEAEPGSESDLEDSSDQTSLEGLTEVALMARTGIRVGEVVSKDQTHVVVRKKNGKEEKFLLSAVKFEYE